jgi:hypothetical protein
MSRKAKANQKPRNGPRREVLRIQSLSSFGKKVVAGGIGVVIMGFWALSLTDTLGRNWASTISPFLILCGYAIIATGILHSSSSTQ